MSDFQYEYLGETRERKTSHLIALSLFAPGMGFVYAGQLLKGISINLFFVLFVELFIISFSFLKFFPALPLFVLTVSWIVLTIFAIDAARKTLTNEPYLLKSFNHPLMYALIATLTFLGPLLATGQFAMTRLLTFVPVEHAALTPSVAPGDVLLVDRTTYTRRTPRRGELLALREQPNVPNALRTVAVEGDVVRIDGIDILVNELPLQHIELQIAGEQEDLLAMVEENNGSRYVVAISPRAYTADSMQATELKENEVFALADNRNQIPLPGAQQPPRDSRNFGPLSTDEIIGKPLFIAWSTEPQTGNVRWDRIGLRLR